MMLREVLMFLQKMILLTSFFTFSSAVWAMGNSPKVSSSQYKRAASFATGIMLAKKKKERVRKKKIVGEATYSASKSKTNLDFDSVDISGQRKTPLGSLVNQTKSDKNYDFVKIRLEWRKEMIQSASSLDAAN